MKKFFAVFIVLMLATPVFALYSTETAQSVSTSNAPALTTASVTPSGYGDGVDTTPTSSSLTINLAAYAFDFDAAISPAENLPGYPFWGRNYETGAGASALTFIEGFDNDNYWVALYQLSTTRGVVILKSHYGTTLTAKEFEIQTNQVFILEGAKKYDADEFFVFGQVGGTENFAIMFSWDGSSLTVSAAEKFITGSGIPNEHPNDALVIPGPTDDVIVFATALGGYTNWETPAAIITGKNLIPTDSRVDWLHQNAIDVESVFIEGVYTSPNTQIFITARSVGLVYVWSNQISDATGLFSAADVFRNTVPLPSGMTSCRNINDLIVDNINNFVTVAEVELSGTFYGWMFSIDNSGSLVYSLLFPQNYFPEDLNFLGSDLIVGVDAPNAAALYSVDTAGTTNFRKETSTGTALGNVQVVQEVFDPVNLNQEVAFGGTYSPGGSKESFGIFDVASATFMTLVTTDYPSLANEPHNVKGILYSSADDAMIRFSNNGLGNQNYDGPSSSISMIPEFSLATLLLAVLLAGSLVVFVVRRRK